MVAFSIRRDIALRRTFQRMISSLRPPLPAYFALLWHGRLFTKIAHPHAISLLPRPCRYDFCCAIIAAHFFHSFRFFAHGRRARSRRNFKRSSYDDAGFITIILRCCDFALWAQRHYFAPHYATPSPDFISDAWAMIFGGRLIDAYRPDMLILAEARATMPAASRRAS